MKANRAGNRAGRAFFGSLLSVSPALFWFGVLWCTLGMVIAFVPGGEQSWFMIGAVLVAVGVLVPSRIYRIAAIVLTIFEIYGAFEGRLRGIEYRRNLESKSAEQRQRIP